MFYYIDGFKKTWGSAQTAIIAVMMSNDKFGNTGIICTSKEEIADIIREKRGLPLKNVHEVDMPDVSDEYVAIWDEEMYNF